jgi:ribosomal protein S18 acetylase RimI-like enzyme
VTHDFLYVTYEENRAFPFLTDVRMLFREYARDLGVDLDFQGFEQELAGLPGDYAPPKGLLLVAYEQNTCAGCVAVRPRSADVCEMKRLYVQSRFRRRGVGRSLAVRTITFARNAGYRSMVLDTLERLEEAIGLYVSLGFRRIPPYYQNPLQDAVYLGIDL